jgi:hypothetical protein
MREFDFEGLCRYLVEAGEGVESYFGSCADLRRGFSPYEMQLGTFLGGIAAEGLAFWKN